MNDSALTRTIIIRVPMVSNGHRAISTIEKQLPSEIRSGSVVKGVLTIDYVDDVVIFEMEAP